MVKSLSSSTGMQANKKAALKQEEDRGPSASPTVKREATDDDDDDDDDDDVPLGERMKSEAKKAAEASSSPKTQKKKKKTIEEEELDEEDEEDDLPLTKKKKTKAKENGQLKKEPKLPTTKVKTQVMKSDAVSSSKGKASIKTVKKEKVVVSSVKQTSATGTPKKKKVLKEEPEKREKKVYDLPGQKHDPPDERDPIRIFYESLYNENPESEMAELWMMEHGLLEADDAERAFQKKKKNQLTQKLLSPGKPPATDVNIESVRKSSIKIIEKTSKVQVSKVKKKADSGDADIILKPKKKIKKQA